jgi:hypothetical protein
VGRGGERNDEFRCGTDCRDPDSDLIEFTEQADPPQAALVL